MKTITKVATLGIALAALGTSFEAAATCYALGKIRAIYSNGSGANNYSYVYFDPQTTTSAPGYTWYTFVYGTDTALIDALGAAHAGNHTVALYGDASSCPTTATGLRYTGVTYYGYTYSRY